MRSGALFGKNSLEKVAHELEGRVGFDIRISSEKLLNQEPDSQNCYTMGLNERDDSSESHGD